MPTTVVLTPKSLRALAKEAETRSIPAPLVANLREAADDLDALAKEALGALEQVTTAELREVLVLFLGRPAVHREFNHLFTFIAALEDHVDFVDVLAASRTEHDGLLREIAEAISEEAAEKVEYALDTAFDVVELGMRHAQRVEELVRNPVFMTQSLGFQAYFLLLLSVLLEAMRKRKPHATGVMAPLADEFEEVAQAWFKFCQSYFPRTECGPSVSVDGLVPATDDEPDPPPPGSWVDRLFAA